MTTTAEGPATVTPEDKPLTPYDPDDPTEAEFLGIHPVEGPATCPGEGT